MGKILDDSELGFFDSVNAELNELSGTEVNFYGMSAKKGKVDPLYGEHTEREPDGPYRLWAHVEWPQISVDVSEQGYGVEFDSQAVVSRSHFDAAGSPYPSAGDVIEMWRTPYHDANSKGKGLYFDVIKVDNDGHIHDTPSFTQFKLTLKRRSQFGAERRISPP